MSVTVQDRTRSHSNKGRQALLFNIAVVLTAFIWAGEMMAAASAQPTVFWASDPVDPGQTVLLVGDRLDEVGTVSLAPIADSLDQAAASSDTVQLQPIQASSTSLKLILPQDIKAGAFHYWFGNDRTHIYELNVPIVYWLQGDFGMSASAGGWLRIFGRNIARGDATRAEIVRSDGSRRLSLKSSSASLWEADFQLSRDIEPGSYLVRIWNGNGDRGSWREAGSLEVAAPPRRADVTINVRDYGAVGDGIADDTDAFKRALAVLSDKGGGTLWLAQGYYKLSEGLTLPSGTRLKGADRNLVHLTWPDFAQPPFALVQGASDFEIEDVTLVAFNHGHIISGGFREGTSEAISDAKNIAIRRVTIRASMYRGHLKPEETTERLKSALKYSSGGPDSVRLSGSDLTIVDSDVYGSGRSLYLNQPRGAYIARNKFYNGRWGWYSISGADRVIFEDNEVSGADLQSTGGGINTLKSGLFAQNVAFLRNRFSRMHGWDREAMTSDGPGGCFFGSVAGISLDRMTISLQPQAPDKPIDLSRCVGAGLFVLGGRGSGQVRRVTSISSDSLHLDRPFDVDPDANSVVTVTSYQRNYLLIGNEFSDAGLAIQLFGSAVNHVIANNVSRRTGGFLARGLKYGEYQPVWYSQFLGNQIAEGDLGRDAVIATWGSQKPPNSKPLSMGTIIRGNRLDGGAHVEVRGYMADAPGVKDVVIEDNQISNAKEGVIVDRGAVGVLIRNNTFHNVGRPTVDQSAKSP